MEDASRDEGGVTQTPDAPTSARKNRWRLTIARIPGRRHALSTGDLEAVVAARHWMEHVSVARFLECLTARRLLIPPRLRKKSIHLPQVNYLKYINSRITNDIAQRSIQIWKIPPSATRLSSEKVFDALATLLAGLSPEASVDNIMERLVSKGIFDETIRENEGLQHLAHSFIYSALGCVTMMYMTEESADSKKQQTDQTITLHNGADPLILSPENVRQPFVDSLRVLGGCLPRKDDSYISGQANALDTILASNLNLASICHSSYLEIDWVLSFGQHARLDRKRSRLALFAFPSLCEILSNDESCPARLSTEFYEEWSRPVDFSFPDYMVEILRSYDLIFNSKRAKSVYKRHERSRICDMMGQDFDTHLDTLCHRGSTGRFIFKETYSKAADFPILSARLTELHDYVESQRPSRIMALWRDRRNLLNWYTLWAVLILGLLGIISSVVQIGVGGMQAAYSYKAYQLQLSSNPG